MSNDFYIFHVIACLISSFIIVWISVPSIVKVSKNKHLFDEPDERSSHSYNVPILGGLAIFAGLIISVSLWASPALFPAFQYIVASIIVIFFIGI